jgi:hypothetical protein
VWACPLLSSSTNVVCDSRCWTCRRYPYWYYLRRPLHEEHTPKINIKLYPLLTPPDKATREESFFPGAMHPQNFVHISEHAHPAAPLPSDIPLFLLPPASLYLYLPVPLLSFSHLAAAPTLPDPALPRFVCMRLPVCITNK